jgi:glycosyltransferase involved in cell wall biosynthesis
MKIAQVCDYKFPAKGSAGSERIVERLCRGFVKLGHEVTLVAKEGSTVNIDKVRVLNKVPDDVEILHFHGIELEKQNYYESFKKPWVGTIHGGGMESNPAWLKLANNHPNVICVSKFVADRLNCQAFVHSCASDEELEFKQTVEPDGGFLYLAGFGWGIQKGLDVFIDLSKKFPRERFFIAGAGGDPGFVEQIKQLCKQQLNLSFIGEVNGKEKSNILGNVKALIYPTHLPDACPASVVEALFCGTPVIGSVNGSMPELVPAQCGYICKSQADYVKAVLYMATNEGRRNKINRQDCRDYAVAKYSDIIAAEKHLIYYENMIKSGRTIA